VSRSPSLQLDTTYSEEDSKGDLRDASAEAQIYVMST
jgi:hypothetical protein